MFNEATPEKKEKSLQRQRQARKLIRNGIEAAREQLRLGGHLGWEWPNNNAGWHLREMRQFLLELRNQGRYHPASVHGCAYGLKNGKGNFLKKPWRVILTAPMMAASLERRCPGHEHHDECLGGVDARNSGFYPQQMCSQISRAVRDLQLEKAMTTQSAFPAFPTDSLSEDKKMSYEPLTEKEKQASLRLIEKLHRRTGHPSNSALSSTLAHRGAHPEVVDLARKHVCPDCQELRLAPLNPTTTLERSETLWETVVLDNAEFPIDNKIVHCMIMVDEASRMIVPHYLFEHGVNESRNCTGSEAVQGIQDTWVRHYGLPASIRLDAEGAFRSGELQQWAEQRGVEVLPCAAEAHGQIGIAERSIQTIKSTVKQLLQGSDFSGWDAVVHACQAHNELSRTEGFSPYQWTFGRQPSLTGRLHNFEHDVPFWTSSAVAGSDMAANLKMRVRAQQTFLRSQAQDQVTRALNSKTRRNQIFVPGDLVYFKRIKPPAQPLASVRMGHKLWRWYGPGRVLATETKTDAIGEERKPSHIIWIVSHGRLKRCAPEQLRHASSREQLLAENSETLSATWTFHSLAQTLYKGEFEVLDNYVFPGDSEMSGPPRQRRARSASRGRSQAPGTPVHRSRSVEPPFKVGKKTSQEVHRGTSSGEAHKQADVERMTLQELYESSSRGERAHQKSGTKRENKIPEGTQDAKKAHVGDERTQVTSTSSNSVPTSGERYEGLDLSRFLGDMSYMPTPAMVQRERPTNELFQQPLFKKARRDLYGEEPDDEALFFTADGKISPLMQQMACTIEIDLPERLSEWKRMQRSPHSFYVKKVKGAEVKWHLLSPEQKAEFDKAKQAEISQWLATAAVRRAIGPVPQDRLVQMRWVLTWKDSGAAKGRIVLIGYQDPDLHKLQSSAPTMSRRTRQVCLQYSSVKCWRTLKADVKAAFLQGDASEESRQLFAKPVPELAKAMNLKEHEMVQVLKSCYGLVTAPAQWYKCVAKTLKDIGFYQCKTDPCLWVLHDTDADGKTVSLGYICSHVDDFLISGSETSEKWVNALHAFYSRFKWSPWEFSSYKHCGVQIREEPDFSYTLDHSSFCENIEQVTFKNRADHEPVNDEELSQLRGALGALQWRAHQTGPHLSARLGQLQSEIARATVGTIKATNKLIRECFQTRHMSTRINQLGVQDPSQVCFVAWSDAALANRVDLGSTGGYVIAATTAEIFDGHRAPVSLISWRSGKLARKARSSLSAEAQALSEADQELMFVRFAWSELCGHQIDPRNADPAIASVRGAVVIDAKSLYDILLKRDLNSAAAGLKDKYSSLEVLCLLESLERLKTEVRWVHSHAQLADALTKPLPPGILHKVMSEGHWTIHFDPSFTSAKKLKAGQRANYIEDFRGVSVFVSNHAQVSDCSTPFGAWPNLV